VKFKKGSWIPASKASDFNRRVAGQIPGVGRYGIPDDVASQVDRATLWALVCTAETLDMSGITDPCELYKYMHPSEVGSRLGSGMGGVTSLRRMLKDRREEARNDTCQRNKLYAFTGACAINSASTAPRTLPLDGANLFLLSSRSRSPLVPGK
jgi:fatty acid synthase subunit alpha